LALLDIGELAMMAIANIHKAISAEIWEARILLPKTHDL